MILYTAAGIDTYNDTRLLILNTGYLCWIATYDIISRLYNINKKNSVLHSVFVLIFDVIHKPFLLRFLVNDIGAFLYKPSVKFSISPVLLHMVPWYG